MSDAAFPQAIAKVLVLEGGYVDDPDDPGGETNFGISRRAYPELSIAALDRDMAISIYRRDYWDKPGLGQLPDRIGAKMLDMGVNMGQRTAAKLLQRSCNRFGTGAALAIDGIIGPATVTACSAISDVALVQALRNEAANHYREIASEHPTLRKFLNGWLRRAAS